MDGIAVIAGAQAPAVADDEEHLPPLAPGVALRQGAARHLRGLGDPHDVQNRGRHIAEGAVPQGDGACLAGVHQDKGHQIGGVGAVGLAGGGVQLFDVAVVRGHGHHVVPGQSGLHHLLQGPADVAAGLQLGGGVLGVADDVAVGEVGDDKVVFPQGVRHGPGHLRQGQLRLLVKVDALGRGDAHILLAGEGGVFPAVEEKGHMGELLGLRAVELAFAGLGEDLCQGL